MSMINRQIKVVHLCSGKRAKREESVPPGPVVTRQRARAGTMSAAASSATPLLAGFIAGTVVASLVAWLIVRPPRRRQAWLASSVPAATSPPVPAAQSTGELAALTDRVLRPPLPDVVARMLESASLAYLTTSTIDPGGESSPHVSLMRFSYLSDESVIVISTAKKTKKYLQMKRSPQVAMLVHDFPNAGRGAEPVEPGERPAASGATVSITLNGLAVIEEGPEAERHRALHLQANPGYEQFIVGENIAIVAIFVHTARICNVRDEVQHWYAGQGDSTAASPRATPTSARRLPGSAPPGNVTR